MSFENKPARDLFADLAFLAYLGAAILTAWQFVNRAIDLYADLIAAERQAAIKSPYPGESQNVEVDDQTLAEVWQAW